jgi:hypothetical protein
MVRTKQDRKDEWERKRVQRVLDYHNKKYGTRIKIKDRTTRVYPQLKGQINWDWVCYETETGEEIAAIEVKRLTDSELEGRRSILWQLLEEVRDSLNDAKELPGTFVLSVEIPNYYPLPFKRENKQEFKNILYEVIRESAQRLKLREEKELITEISRLSSFRLDNVCFFTLTKLYNEGSLISQGFGIGGVWSSRSFDDSELKEFEQLVSHANIQLKKANVKEAFLVIIEEGYRWKNPPAVEEAFKNMDSANYSDINRVYFVSGAKVVEISLPAL